MADRQAALKGQPNGLSASKMTPKQRDLLNALLEEYATSMPEDVAAARMEQVKAAGANIFFAWAGVEQKGGPHYYRVQSPTFLVEYDNTQNEANTSTPCARLQERFRVRYVEAALRDEPSVNVSEQSGHTTRVPAPAVLAIRTSGARVKQQQVAAGGPDVASDAKRYADAATEFPVIRYTSPEYSSLLPSYYNRSMSGRNTLYFACDRTGRMEILRGDIRNGQTRQMTTAEALDPQSIALLPGDRSLCFFDGPSLRQLTFASQREREVYRVPDGVTRGRGFSISTDGARAFFIEQADGKNRLIAVNLAKGQVSTVVESPR